MAASQMDNNHPGEAPQTTQRQQEPDIPQSTPNPMASKDIAVSMSIIAALLYISRYQLDFTTIWRGIPLFLVLKFPTFLMTHYVLELHCSLKLARKPPFKGQDCNLAALLAVSAFVVYHRGEIGMAFLGYQAESWYWIGYWLEWWTGIIGFLFYLFGCTPLNKTRATLKSEHGVQAGSSGDVCVELENLSPAETLDVAGIRHGFVCRYRKHLKESLSVISDRP